MKEENDFLRRLRDFWPVYWELTKQVKGLFDKEGITIPKQEILVHSAE